MQNEGLFDAAYQASAAFLYLFAETTAFENMGEENALKFGKSLLTSFGEVSAGKHGFDREPRKAFKTLSDLIPKFLSQEILNVVVPGSDDCLGNILKHLSCSADGKTLYAFLLGSESHNIGLAMHYLTITTDMGKLIRNAAHDLGW